MIDHKSGGAILAIAVWSLVYAIPQPAGAQGVLEDCESAIASYCAQVTPGDGRVISCLYAHEDHLDEGCANAIADAGDILDYVFASIRGALSVCAADIESKCPGVQVGGGRIMTCLQENAADIAPECKTAIDRFSAELANE